MPALRYTAAQVERAEELLGANKAPKPTHSELTFKVIAERSGVPASVVTAIAVRHGIRPPVGMRGPRVGAPGAGRPRGPGKKLGERSPYRQRAKELRALGMSYRDIAAQITAEVRAAAQSTAERRFKISSAAIYNLINSDEETARN